MRKTLRAVDIERLENTSFASAAGALAGVGAQPNACAAFSCDGGGCSGVTCQNCTANTCIGISCTGAGKCCTNVTCYGVTEVQVHACVALTF